MAGELDKLEETQDILISAIAQSMVAYGVSPSVGRIYGVLYFSDEPLTLDEIKEQVSMSKASVSNGVRELMDTEMVTKVWKKGQRKDHFIAEKDFLNNFLNYFVKQIRLERSLIAKAIEQTEDSIKEIAVNAKDAEAGELAKRDLELISNTKSYLDWLMRLANYFESKEVLEQIPKKNND
ncbi:GbsR/MarR family transcriptional regulator [Virgibacillus kimchii]